MALNRSDMTSNTHIPANLPPHRLSVVVPMYNEEELAHDLINAVQAALASYPQPWELIVVDDGSRDRTWQLLRERAREVGPHIRIVRLLRNFRQTAAMQAGIDAARGDVIVTMDGDLQNDPADIPKLVHKLLTDDLDMVAGWRQNRQDGFLLRKLPSRLANRLIRRVSGLEFQDLGCSLKAFRTEVVRKIRLYGEMHRFIPAWLATVTTPKRIAQEVVAHHPRVFGQSKYGISRTFRVVLDLVFVYFFMRYRTRPGHFFGGIGIALGGLGGLILTYLMALKVFFGESIGTRPLLFGGFFLVIAGIQMVTSGVLAELLARVYFESGITKPYLARPTKELSDAAGWAQTPEHHE